MMRILVLPLCVLFSLSYFSTLAQTSAAEKLKVAATQFPVSGNIKENANYIKKFMREAASNGANIIQFPEAALSGYPPVDVSTFKNYDWDLLRTETKEIMALAGELHMWVVLGSAHFISENEKPLNCLYIISDEGKIVDRYDKSMLTDGDLKYFTPGNHIVIREINGFKIGFLICYDSCFPEMYNIYNHKDVTIMFHSFYNARHEGKSILDDVIPAEIRVRASDNLMWVVASNSSGDYSSWPTCIARPDGSLESLERGVPGILYREFPDNKLTTEFSSWTHNNKKMALPEKETYHNGKPSTHPRAADVKSLP
ncbi:MAG: carbon-nitrogen hydrolase family protein [Chitinophagaceae bacterium]|nr:carbon-nitrogen hydrolase family protein [Chitinophagaceae bacterium]